VQEINFDIYSLIIIWSLVFIYLIVEVSKGKYRIGLILRRIRTKIIRLIDPIILSMLIT